jgi:hypothetical protein
MAAQIAKRAARTAIQNSRSVIRTSDENKDVLQHFFSVNDLVPGGDVSAFLRADVADDVAYSFACGVHFDNCAKFHRHLIV